jgi:hypothetical protein
LLLHEGMMASGIAANTFCASALGLSISPCRTLSHPKISNFGM